MSDADYDTKLVDDPAGYIFLNFKSPGVEDLNTGGAFFSAYPLGL